MANMNHWKELAILLLIFGASSNVTWVIAMKRYAAPIDDGRIPPASRTIRTDKPDEATHVIQGEAIMASSVCEKCGHTQRFWVKCEESTQAVSPEWQAWYAGALAMLEKRCTPEIVEEYKQYVEKHGVGPGAVTYFRSIANNLSADDLNP